jgi:hypothetical protein
MIAAFMTPPADHVADGSKTSHHHISPPMRGFVE